MFNKWFYNFVKRWPDISVVKPSSLETVSARCTKLEVIDKYFSELELSLDKCNLNNKPECITDTDKRC